MAGRGTGPESSTQHAAVTSSFGLAHLHGIPDEPIGVAMVVVWGVVLAILRLRTRGMLATYVAHVLADATIVALLVPVVLAAK